MSEQKHTPGPWHVNPYQSDDGDHCIDDDMGQVAKTYCEANARLIAAAPLMLEILQEIVVADEKAFGELKEMGLDPDADGALKLTNKARAAIAKAVQS